MKPELINRLIAKREKMTSRRDGLYDHRLIDRIDERLARVPPGVNNDIDKLLARPGAVLPERVEYNVCRTCNGTGIYAPRGEYLGSCPTCQRPSTDTAAATEAVAELAQAKQDEYLRHIADQHEDRLDFLRLCGDLAI